VRTATARAALSLASLAKRTDNASEQQ